MNLYKRVRTKAVLHRAWTKIRTSGKASDSETTKKEIEKFEANWLNNLENIRDRLKKGTFAFDGERGVTPPKAKGKTGVRPLVVAPIANRVVRRAILEVLQGYGDEDENHRQRWAGVAAVRNIMATPTSVGGIKKRGVPEGLALIDKAVRAKSCWFVRSDIKNFFTRIPKADVCAFMRDAIQDDEEFLELFDLALATSLENQDELEETASSCFRIRIQVWRRAQHFSPSWQHCPSQL